LQTNNNPTIEHTPEFDKCMHHLKKFKTIEEDLIRFKNVLLANFPDLKPWGLDVNIIKGVSGTDYMDVYVAKKFRCVYLKSHQKIRLVYTYAPLENKIIFIEIYFKGDNEIENIDLIKRYLIKKNPQQPVLD
jgi:hypothetical protein